MRCLLALLLALAAAPAWAQQTPADTLAAGAAADTLAASPPAAARATIDPADDEPLGVPLAPPAEGGLEEPIAYAARDSVVITLAPREGLPEGARPDDTFTLFGGARATYREATLEAGVLSYRFGPEELRATPLPARGAGPPLEVPQFARGTEQFSGLELVYNLRSERGRVVGARTAIEDGFLLGGIIRQQDARVIYVQNAAYTTCDHEHPHYAVEASRLMVVDGRTVYTGPVRLRLLGLPTPLWLPFGYFPATEGRRSGPLAVGYGQSADFGLFLRDVGWYWAASDYFDALVKGQIGTRGSFQAEGVVAYARRYAYSGRLGLAYGRLRRGERTDLDFAVSTPVSLTWSHDQTLPAGQRLSASVDLRSNAQRFVSTNIRDQVQQSTTSTVSYNQSWPRVGRALSLSVRGTQQLQTGQASFTLPQVALSQQRRFPFRPAGRRGTRWYEQIGVSYTGAFTNTYDFRPVAGGDSTVSFLEGLFRPSAFRAATGQGARFAYAAQHSVPVSASYRIDRYRLNVLPSLSYTETWTGRRTERVFDPRANAVQEVPVEAFTAIRRPRASLGLSSEFFGTFPLRVGPLDGLRHVVRPTVSLNAEPDYARAPFRYVRTVQADASGRTQTYAIAPGVPLAPTAALGVSVDNAFLTRLVQTDTTGEVQRRTLQVLSLSLSSGYNFADPLRPVQDLSLAGNSQLGAYRINVNGQFSAYALDSLGVATSVPYVTATGRPLRLTGFTVSAGTQFSARRGAGQAEDLRLVSGAAVPGAPGTLLDPLFPDYRPSALGYVDFAAPWSFSLDFTAGYAPRPPGLPSAFQRSPWNAVLSVNQFNFRLTPNWAVTGSTGYDLAQRRATLTQLALRRDLHCWEMQLQVVPFGQFQQVSFSLYVKSGYLRDLLRLDLPNTDARSAFRNVARF
ncbi:MAG: putative LPS assembly protein LptD [Rubricoccaceae bacterium]